MKRILQKLKGLIVAKKSTSKKSTSKGKSESKSVESAKPDTVEAAPPQPAPLSRAEQIKAEQLKQGHRMLCITLRCQNGPQADEMARLIENCVKSNTPPLCIAKVQIMANGSEQNGAVVWT